MKVVEIFNSIEGEGKRAGLLCTFVRFAGCNLRCNYCDTKYSYDLDQCEDLSIKEIIDCIAQYKTKRITLTGGEPLLQDDISELIDQLIELGYEINVETNGAVDIKPFVRESDKLFFTMDYKSKSSGMNGSMISENFFYLKDTDVLKYVVQNRNDLDDMRLHLLKLKNRAFITYVSPVWECIEPRDIVNYMKEYDLDEVRIQVQLHKVIWDPGMRGV